MKFKAWAKDTLVRAIKTAAQAAVGLLAIDQTGVIHTDLTPQAIGWAALAAGGVSVLQNLANLKVSDTPPVLVISDSSPLILDPAQEG